MTQVTQTITVTDMLKNARDFGHEKETSEKSARAVWTMIAEPGNADIGALIGERGALSALRLVTETQQVSEGIIDVQSIREQVLPRYTLHNLRNGFAAAARYNAELIVPEDPHWPTGVNDLGTIAPYALWARGNTAILVTDKRTSLTGSRAASGYGEHCSMEIAAGLVDQGHTIITGAAYGIEGMALRSALASRGNTVAILAGGVDRFYPSGHDTLLERVAEAGVVVSELSCGAAPTKWRFLLRNRLLSAIAERVVVIEAGCRSGAISTAEHALSLNRPLGAVPGPVTSSQSSGCHRLIREFGATLVTNADEVAAL